MEQRFQKHEFNIREYMEHTWSIDRGDQFITFKIRFSSQVARYVREEELFVKPQLKENNDGSLILEVTVNNDREFLAWLNQYGPDAEVLQPASYRTQLKERLAQWQTLYEE
jgi:predicted DNA-binding transcriptional regulator YafY